MHRFPSAVRLVAVLVATPFLAFGQLRINTNVQSAQIRFGIERIRQATGMQVVVNGQSGHPDILLVVDKDLEGVRKEGFEIIRKGALITVRSVDETGGMYGLLDVAGNASPGGGLDAVGPKRINPHFSVRAIKFNLPWSSYRTGPAMQQHMEVCRDLHFWESFLDQMAENRFNLLSLWNVHPFSFMVKPHNFPHANDFTSREMAEWKKFWTTLFRMCRDRGIEPFIVNWNIAVSPEFAKHYKVKERNDTSAIVRKYTREVVKQVIDEYPDLAGIGITLADWMSNFRQPGSTLPEMTPADREDWLAETVITGMKLAGRRVKLLHRSVLSADPAEMRRVIDDAELPDTTLVEVKFNWSHGHSSTKLFLTHDRHSGEVENNYWNPLPSNYRIQWMIRNEDFFILRWGQPDFIRKHIRENTKPYVNGYFIGSEGYIPAMDFSHLSGSHRDWKYAFEKQWLFYHLWGRLLYDPGTGDEVFASAFQKRYGVDNGRAMLDAYTRASNMPLRLASFHAATWDYTLYSEGFLAPFASNGGAHDTVSSFISIDELIRHPTLDPAMISIEDFVRAALEGDTIADESTTPPELADMLDADAQNVLQFVARARPGRGALACELDDLETWAYLGNYFADKIRGAVALHSYRSNRDQKEKERAIAALSRCVDHWRRISEITSSHYAEVSYIDHLGYGIAYRDAQTFSWKKYLPQVMRDLEIARGL